MRLVFEPKTQHASTQHELITTLLAHTSLESSAPINLTMVGGDGRPTQKSLRQMLGEWIAFRLRDGRAAHRGIASARCSTASTSSKAGSSCCCNIDEVIRIIRAADEPKPALIERFSAQRAAGRGHPRDPPAPAGAARGDQDRAGAEGAARRAGASSSDILASPAALKRTVIKEIEADAKAHGDERRTLIQAEKRAVAEVRVVDEPVTVVVSMKGWVRALKGHEHRRRRRSRSRPATRCTAPSTAAASTRCWCSAATAASTRSPVASLPGGRGDGQPITTLIDLEAGTQPAHYFAGAASEVLLLAGTGGFGLLARARRPAVAPARRQDLPRASRRREAAAAGASSTPSAARVACLTLAGRLLVFGARRAEAAGATAAAA